MDLVVYDAASREVTKQTHRVVGLKLKEIVKQFNSPVTEEQAWAVAYLAASRLAEIQWAPGISLDSIVVTKTGSVELLKENGKIHAVQEDMTSVMESLGVAIYQLLDYGLSEDQERTLSQPLESLIEMMTELNAQSVDELEVVYPDGGMGSVQGSPTSLCTRDSGITVEPAGVREEQLARVLKTCELHVIEVADPIEHFRQISSGMVEEAIHIMKLQSEDTEQESGTLGQDSQIVETWKHVMEDIKNGAHLQPVLEAVDGRAGLNLSEFDHFLMSISKFEQNKLHHVELDDSGKPMFDHPLQSPLDKFLSMQSSSLPHRRGRRATVGDVHSTMMSEIKTRPALKPVSCRQLHPVSLLYRPLSPMECLLEEILTPPPLKRVERVSPKRLSMSVECYRMCRSNPDLLDNPSSPNPFSQYTDAQAYSWNRNLSMSVSSLTYGGSIDALSSSTHHTHPTYTPPPTPYTLTGHHQPPNEHRQKSKKRGTFFQKIANKITHKDTTTTSYTNRRSSCPTLLDEAVPIVTPYDSTGYYNTARDIRTSVPGPNHRTSIPGPNHRTSLPGPNHRTSLPGPNHRMSVPGQNYRTFVPGTNHLTFVPGQNHRTFVPGQNHRTSVPGQNHLTSIPGQNHCTCPNYFLEDDVFIADSRNPTIFQYPQPRQPDHLRRQSLSSLPKTRGPRNERVTSWAFSDDVSRGGKTSREVEKEERKSPWDVPGPSIYSRPSHFPHILTPTGPPLRPHTLTPTGPPPRPHTLTTTGLLPHTLTPQCRLPSPLVDDSMTTLSDISLHLSVDEDPSNLAEMIHVRSNVTGAELYNLQLEDRKDFENIQDEKVCFSCHKTKFSVFNQAHKCYVCQRRVCSKCGKKHSLKGPPTHPRLVALFREAAGDLPNVYLCTSCLLYVCPEAKDKKKENYDC